MFNIPPHAFAFSIEITAADIDVLNHVNNTVYLRWVQQVATAHWESLTTPKQREEHWWVVRRHEIDYLRPCLATDSITAYTWVLPPKGKDFDRVVVFKNNATEKIMTQVKTTWIMVDPISQRGVALPKAIRELFGV